MAYRVDLTPQAVADIGEALQGLSTEASERVLGQEEFLWITRSF